jgi:hypothetical protein
MTATKVLPGNGIRLDGYNRAGLTIVFQNVGVTEE